jgi:hypothetical protein
MLARKAWTGRKRKTAKSMSPPSLFPGVLARIRAKISEHQREKRPPVRRSDDEKEKSPRVFRPPENKVQADFTGVFEKVG